MTTQKQKHDDAAVQTLETYKELRRRLEAQAPLTMAAVNAAELYDRTGLAAPPEVIDAAIGAFWKLEEIERTIEPFYDAGFPRVQYERPDLDKLVTPDTSDPWEAWRKDVNIITSNNDTGKRF
jgi:hypothetical protein